MKKDIENTPPRSIQNNPYSENTITNIIYIIKYNRQTAVKLAHSTHP